MKHINTMLSVFQRHSCICQVIIWTPEGPISYASESLIVIFLPWYNCYVYVLNGNKMFLNWIENWNRVRSRPVPGRKGPGRPKKTWDECVKQDLKVCVLSEAGTQDRVLWRSSVKNSRQEPTPSNGSAPQSMAAPPARRVLGMCTRSFNKTGFDWLITINTLSACKGIILANSVTSTSADALPTHIMMTSCKHSIIEAASCFCKGEFQ